MDIALIYSEKDPRQTEARDFLRNYIEERGVLARITETEQEVASPTLVINGHTLKDSRQLPRKSEPVMFPAIADIAQALERHLWCV